MTKPYRDSVLNFISHFRNQGDEIAEVPSELHRKVLYTLALDPLARAAYGKAKSRQHRDNYIRLLTEHGNWIDSTRVSLPQLLQTLKRDKRTRFSLYRKARQMLSEIPVDTLILLDRSPALEALQPYVLTNEEGETLKLHTYASLFYDYRNHLVHELREPGYGSDWTGRSNQPYYTDSAFGDRELVFPVRFVQGLYKAILDSLEKMLIEAKLAPHSQFIYGSYWKHK